MQPCFTGLALDVVGWIMAYMCGFCECLVPGVRASNSIYECLLLQMWGSVSSSHIEGIKEPREKAGMCAEDLRNMSRECCWVDSLFGT